MEADDLQLAIFSAAKEGKLNELKEHLSSKSESQLKALTSTKVGGSTPLICASREGHLDVVRYLIVKCHADMKQCGSVVFDGETIEDAPPLWCAAAAGHYDIVKCLIEHKADPNCRTLTNSTPLRAACFDGHHKIVKYLLSHSADLEIANRHDHTCLMIACYKGHVQIVKTLLEAGAKVNRCSVKKNTALHDCAENGSIVIAKLLLQYGAKMQKDSNRMTPLMTAALAGHVELTEYFASLPCILPVEKVNAYEILGTTFLDKHHQLT
jgi:ankyrin repeat protein